MKYELSLVGRQYEVTAPDLGELSVADAPFLRPLSTVSACSGKIHFALADSLPEPPADAALFEDVLFAPSMAHMVWYCSGREHAPIAAADFSEAPDTIRMTGLLAFADRLCSSRFFTRLLCAEKIINALGGILLHSSLIALPAGGLIFSGESGIGKSTQAALWETHAGAEVLNGDRSGIVPEKGGWCAYGLPMAGSSEIYKNKGTPLSALIVLRKAPENSVIRLRPAAAFTRLYPQVNIHRWDRAFGLTAADNLIRLVASVPAYELACRPDVSAVRLLEHAVFG